MTFLATLQAFFQAATAYFNLKNKLAFWDIEEKVDSRLDKMDKQRESLRLIATQEAQSQASNILLEIIEEKKKFTALKKDFNLWTSFY